MAPPSPSIPPAIELCYRPAIAGLFDGRKPDYLARFRELFDDEVVDEESLELARACSRDLLRAVESDRPTQERVKQTRRRQRGVATANAVIMELHRASRAANRELEGALRRLFSGISTEVVDDVFANSANLLELVGGSYFVLRFVEEDLQQLADDIISERKGGAPSERAAYELAAHLHAAYPRSVAAWWRIAAAFVVWNIRQRRLADLGRPITEDDLREASRNLSRGARRYGLGAKPR